MTLRTDGMNYPAHERASLRLEIEFGHEIVPGKHAKRDRQKQPEFPRSEINHAEWQQGERTGVKREDLKEYITALKEASDNAQSFKAALDEHGYILAKGDKRTFVIVDQDGDVRSLSRQLGMKPAAFQAFMKSIDLDNLPSVAQAAEMQQHLKPEPAPAPEMAEPGKQEAAPQAQEPAPGLSAEEIRKLQEAIATQQAREASDMRLRQQTEIERTRKAFDGDMAERLGHFDARQEAERARFQRENAPELTGLDLVIDKFQRWWNPKQAQEREAVQQRRQSEMEDRQKRERDEYETLLKQTNDLEIENLADRHAQQRRDQNHRNEEEIERRIREEETARRLLAEIEAREKLREEKRTRDGPDRPPPLTR